MRHSHLSGQAWNTFIEAIPGRLTESRPVLGRGAVGVRHAEDAARGYAAARAPKHRPPELMRRGTPADDYPQVTNDLLGGGAGHPPRHSVDRRLSRAGTPL